MLDPDLNLCEGCVKQICQVLVFQYWSSGDVSSVSMASPDCFSFTPIPSLIKDLVSLKLGVVECLLVS